MINAEVDKLDNAASCPSRYLLDQIGDKWTMLILTALCEKPLRFNELKRHLNGITQKALTQALRRLERNGILARLVIPSSQVAVEYRITPQGEHWRSLLRHCTFGRSSICPLSRRRNRNSMSAKPKFAADTGSA